MYDLTFKKAFKVATKLAFPLLLASFLLVPITQISHSHEEGVLHSDSDCAFCGHLTEVADDTEPCSLTVGTNPSSPHALVPSTSLSSVFSTSDDPSRAPPALHA